MICKYTKTENENIKQTADFISMPIVFISDLHFDFTNKKFKAKAAPKMKDDFITFVKDNYSDCLLCLAGDYFNNYKKTLAFINELETNKIKGFCVLGNHDFWNNCKRSHGDLINLFDIETKSNEYFRLLITGRKYYINDICIIGDTGWTSFRRGKGKKVSLKQFMGLPDVNKVKNFDPEQIRALHDAWVKFANTILSQEEKVLIVTHFPMVDFTTKDNDCWWSSLTDLKGDNSWRIFGHTHQNRTQCNNNISHQRGYVNKNEEEASRFGQYSFYSFGKLEKIFDRNEIISSKSIISMFYSPLIVSNTTKDIALVSAIRRRGFKRCAANKVNFAALANTSGEYLERVNTVINGYLKDIYIGYIRADGIPQRIIESIFASITVLKDNDFTDIRAFVTAAVIKGYVIMVCHI